MHSISVQKRRKRSINFTESDREELMNLVKPHLSVIENKRTDKFTSKLKSKTWENIKSQYNQLNTEPRTALQLKLFYEANKYRMRRMSKTNGDTSSSNEKVADKIVKVELERSTILDALAHAKSEQVEHSGTDTESPKAKIKCVNIERLQQTKRTEQASPAKTHDCENSTRVHASLPTIDSKKDFSSSYDQPTSLNPCALLTGMNIPSSSSLIASLPNKSQPSSSKQDELHTMRMKILEDERLFRRQEHLKHMEYFEIGIMAFKAFLFKQAQAMPLVTSQK